MKVEIRNNQVTIKGYVNVALRDSKRLSSANGEFVEQIEKGAFGDALERADDVQLLFNHKEDRNLGSIKAGNVKLTEDSVGLHIEATVSDAEVVKEARSGKLTGFSFGFRKLADRWEDVANGVQRRFIESMDLLEVSILNVVPAYNDMTLEVRSEVEQRFNDAQIKYEEVVDMTPEERELLQRKTELAEQRSEEAITELRKIEEQLKELQSKNDKKEVENRMEKFNETVEYRNAFINKLIGKELGDEEKRLLAIGTGNGSIVVPSTIQAKIERKLIQFSPVRQLARVMSSSSNMTIPLDGTAPTASWTAENGAITDQNVTLASVPFNAYKLATLVKLSNELINDAIVDIENYIAELIAESFALAEGVAFYNGTGTNAVQGLKVGVTNVFAPATTVYDTLVDVISKVQPKYRANGAWLMSDAKFLQIMKLKDSNGRPLMADMGASITGGVQYSLLGKPVYIDPNLATGEVVFGDFKKGYVIIDRTDMAIKRNDALYMANDQVGIFATKRVDARVLIGEALVFATFTA